ncbi:hypothetical protein [Haliangium sp.]|uniref:hypothetical protein n=1 Tax=Haliangium sp. TaxID=2663208 RepID=UPI003D0EFB9A
MTRAKANDASASALVMTWGAASPRWVKAGLRLAVIGYVSAVAPSAWAGPITGQVYDTASGQPGAGLTLTLLYDQEDPIAPGQRVDEDDLGPGQQDQITNPNGRYRFDVAGGRRYRLVVDASRTSFVAPSTRVPPQAGLAPPGEVVPWPTPAPPAPTDAARDYFLRFDIRVNEDRVENNHIAVDHVRDAVTLRLQLDRARVGIGDLVRVDVEVANSSSLALTAAAGRPAYLRLALPRGLAPQSDQALARLEDSTGARSLRAGADFDDGGSGGGSRRLLRLGPFDLDSGARLVVSVPATVALDARAGIHELRAAVVDAGGVALAPEARTRLELATDPDLDEGMILGRVFCDDDGDGRRDAEERGLLGARVVLDTGAQALTDVEGGYHLSRVPPGTRLVKLDQATLAGGRARARDAQQLGLSRGLPGRVDFPVQCAQVEVRMGSPRPSRAAAGPRPVEIRGDLDRFHISLDGTAVALPRAHLAWDLPAPGRAGSASILGSVPAAGYGQVRPSLVLGWTAPDHIAAASWEVIVARVQSGEAALVPVRTWRGTGPLPATLSWDGLDDQGRPVADGALLAARVSVTGTARAAAAASPWQVVRVGPAAPSARALRWQGALFTGPARAPTATAELEAKVAALLAEVPADDITAVSVRAHVDPGTDRLTALVATQKQAELVAALLAAAGVSEARITARGRGSLEPLRPGAAAGNGRVELTVEAPSAATVPRIEALAPTPTAIAIGGESVPVAPRFAVRRSLAPGDSISVALTATTGEHRAIEVSWRANDTGDTADTADTDGAAAPVEVVWDLAAGSVRVGGQALPAALLALAVEQAPSQVSTTGAGAERRLAEPLRFAIAAPPEVAVTRWSLAVIEVGTEAVVYQVQHDGPLPDQLTWDGRDQDGRIVLAPGRAYRYRLTVDDSSGVRAQTAPGRFEVAPAPPELTLGGELFTAAGALAETARVELARFLAGADTSGCRVVVRLVGISGGSGVDAQLAKATRKAAVRKALRGLGGAAADCAVEVEASPDADTLIARLTNAPATAQPQTEPSTEQAIEPAIAIDGQVLSEAAGTTRVDASRPLSLSLTAGAAGTTVRYSLPPRVQAARARPSGSLAAETTVYLPARDLRLRSRTLGISGRTRPGAKVLAGAVQRGHTRDPEALRSAARTVLEVQPDGRFYGLVHLPDGPSRLVIHALAPAASAAPARADGAETPSAPPESALLTWPLRVDDSGFFFLALGEVGVRTAFVTGHQGGLGLDSGLSAEPEQLAGTLPAPSFAIGPVRVHGRLALYLDGVFSAGAWMPRVDLTAHLDTAREPGTGAFFEQLTDPRTAPPVFGDDARGLGRAIESRDVNTRGKLYLRAQSGDTRAAVGSVHTDLGSGGLFDHRRTVSGAVVAVDRRRDDHRVVARAFATDDLDGLAHEVTWYQATGGSLYYLRHGQVVEGSETVRVVVRDADTGWVVHERTLSPDHDYRIDYASGRLLLTEPLPSTVRSGWLTDGMETSLAPLTGHPVFLEVRYEHLDPAGAGERAAGVYARAGIGRELQVDVGAGVVGERRADGDYSSWGADLTVRPGTRSQVRFDLAGSRASAAPGYLSADGGLGFARVDGAAPGASDALGRDLRMGWRLTQDWHLGDLLGGRPWAERTRIEVDVQDLERGFSAGDAALEQGRFQVAAQLGHQLAGGDQLTLRHHSRVATLPRVGPTADERDAVTDPAATDELSSHRTALQWARTRGRWTHQIEAAHQQVRSDARLIDRTPAVEARRVGVGASSSYALTPRLTIRAGQLAGVDLGQADPRLDPITLPVTTEPGGAPTRDSDPLAAMTTHVGADWALTDELGLGADWYQRWNGDGAGQLGLRAALSETGSMYLRERLHARAGRTHSATVVGAEDRIPGTTGGRSYGELRVEDGAYGRVDRAVLGLGHRWQLAPGLGTALGFEHQHVLAGTLPDGTPLGSGRRHLGHAGVWWRLPAHLTASARAELRVDDGDVEAARLLEDGRAGIEPGRLADHGGVIAGLPSGIPVRDRLQVIMVAGLDWTWTAGHTIYARAHLDRTTAEPAGTTAVEAQHVLAAMGWAYRPPQQEWLQIVARYAHVRDQRAQPAAGAPSPNAPGAGVGTSWSTAAHTLSLMPIVDLPYRLRLSGKLAWKHSRLETEFGPAPGDPGADGPTTAATSWAVLWLARLGYRLYGRWDAGVELRGLHLGGPNQRRLGALVELGYWIRGHIRLGLGYDLSRFSDDELGDLERDQHGGFVRVTGHY